MEVSVFEKQAKKKDTVISVCMFLSGFSCFAQLYYFQPLLPDLAYDFGLTASESSLAVSFSTLGMVLGLVSTMFIADRLPRKLLIGGGLLASSVFSATASFSPVFSLLILLSAAKGYLLSGATSVSMAYIAEEVSERNKGKIMALYIAGNALGGMSGRFISSWIGAVFSWRIASVSIGIICAVFALLFVFFSPRSAHFSPRKENLHRLVVTNLHLITSRALVPFYLTGGLILGVFVSLYNYMGFYLVKEPFAFSPVSIHYIYLMYIFGMFGSMATVRLTRSLTPFTVLKGILLLSATAILLLYVADFGAVTFGLAIFTFNFFVVHVLCNRIVSEYHPAKRSVTLSVYLLTYYLGSSLLGWATGILLDTFGWPYFLGGLIFLVLLNYVIIYREVRRIEKSKMKTDVIP